MKHSRYRTNKQHSMNQNLCQLSVLLVVSFVSSVPEQVTPRRRFKYYIYTLFSRCCIASDKIWTYSNASRCVFFPAGEKSKCYGGDNEMMYGKGFRHRDSYRHNLHLYAFHSPLLHNLCSNPTDRRYAHANCLQRDHYKYVSLKLELELIAYLEFKKWKKIRGFVGVSRIWTCLKNNRVCVNCHYCFHHHLALIKRQLGLIL